MNTQKTILKLFYQSSNWLLKFSFWALPIALFLSIASFLFIDNLLSSYERYLVDSYIGSQGRISIESDDKNLLDNLSIYSTKQQYIYSQKQQYPANVIFKSQDKQISKYAKFIILDKSYLEIKFHQTNIDDRTLFVNKVFLNSMGSLDIDRFNKIYFDDESKVYNISKIIAIDTGFLESRPMVFITSSFATLLFEKLDRKGDIIEFLEKDKDKIDDIKAKAKELAKQYKVIQYKIHDLLNDTKSTKEFFDKVSMIQVGISILLVLLSLGIILLSISISIEFKRNSLQILQLIGMSRRDLSLTISGLIMIMILLVTVLSMGSVGLFQNLFLAISQFHNSFFIHLDMMNIVYIVVLSFVLFVITYISSRVVFKGRS